MKPTNFKQTCKYNKIMKTKEEIEQLAEEFLTFHQEGSKVYHIKIREAIEFAYNKCQEDMADEIVKLEEKLKLIEHISDEMAKDLIEQSEFFYGGFESVSKYYNYKQFCSPYKSGEQITNL